MGKSKIVAGGLVILTPLVVLLVGLLAEGPWALAAAATMLAVTVVAATLLISRQVGVANQRLAGLIKMARGQDVRLQRIERLVDGQIDVNYTVPAEVRRAHEDLVLASRSLTVPQAHFDQLLRTISANAARTEDAIDGLADAITVSQTALADRSPRNERAGSA